tara:strand:+ start:570 stop:959 length:390 start_codon:yes stop_codon:yes gene_type:complete
MAHPSEDRINRLYYVPASKSNVEPVDDGRADHFYAVYCNTGGAVTFFSSVAEFVDVSGLADDAAAQNYIDPTTGVAFVNKAAAVALGDGTYEHIATDGVAITMVAGDTFYGKFTKITTDSSAIVVAYAR